MCRHLNVGSACERVQILLASRESESSCGVNRAMFGGLGIGSLNREAAKQEAESKCRNEKSEFRIHYCRYPSANQVPARIFAQLGVYNLCPDI